MSTTPTKFFPRQGLGLNFNGGPLQNSGSIDSGLLFFNSGGVTVANAETVIKDTGPTGNLILPNGILDISMCSNMGIYINFTLGSLTSADLIPMFSADGIDFLKRGWPAIAAGIVTITPLIYRFTADYIGILALNNPGANYLRFSSASVGVITASELVVSAIRGCAGMGNILAG